MLAIITTGFCLVVFATPQILAQLDKAAIQFGFHYPNQPKPANKPLSGSWSAPPPSPAGGWQATQNTCASTSVPVGSCPIPETQFPTYLPSSTDCSCFFQCSNGMAYQLQCPPNTFWDFLKISCEHPSRVLCWTVEIAAALQGKTVLEKGLNVFEAEKH